MSVSSEITGKLLAFRTLCESRAMCPGIQRIELSIDSVELLPIFNHCGDFARLFWASRDTDESIVGIGVADSIEDHYCGRTKELFGEIAQSLAFADPLVRFYGGASFDDSIEVAAEWESFGHATFVVPVIEIIRREGNYFLAYNYSPGDYGYLESVLKTVLDALCHSAACTEDKRGNSCSAIELVPEKEQWLQNCNAVIGEFDDDFTKVVLARKQVVVGSADCGDVMNGLFARNHSTYNFCFQFEKKAAFMGSSPECLFRMSGDTLYCEAIAGTTYGDDQHSIAYSPKNSAEHAVVHDQLIKDLESLCSHTDVAQERQMLTLRELTHLMSSFSGVLKHGISLADIVARLHPTAAVCGEPRDKAMEVIRRNEPFNRGWYAGPVGWISQDRAEFAVAIRSALIGQNRLSLFAGAGIVEGSIPELEWEETNRKMSQFIETQSGKAATK